MGRAHSQGSSIYLDAGQASALLRVSVSTLYSYVSRKNIRTHKLPGSKSSYYLREDVEQIAAGKPVAIKNATLGLATSSALTLITEDGSFYRGIDSIELARRASLEDVARLLWATESDPFACDPAPLPKNWDALFDAVADYPPMDRCAMLLPALERADDGTDGFPVSAARVIRWMTAIAYGQRRPAQIPIHKYIARITRCGPMLEDAVRRMLVHSADQALEPMTFAVRATANTGASAYRCVLSGLSAATGMRHPAARTSLFVRFIKEIETSSMPAELFKARMAENGTLPGFGFNPFPLTIADPKALHFRKFLRRSFRNDPSFQHFDNALSLGTKLTGQEPDYALLAYWVSNRIRPKELVSITRLSRLVGWLAHSIEQQQQPLVRWKLNYSGPLPD